MKKMLLAFPLALSLALGLAGCAEGGDGDALDDLEDNGLQAQQYTQCTQAMLDLESATFDAYVGCTRAHPKTQGTACASQKSAWDSAYDTAERAGCFD